MAPPSLSRGRAALPSTTKGLGQHFTSPRKVKDPKKTQTYVTIPGRETKRQRLLGRLDKLLNNNRPTFPDAQTVEPQVPAFSEADTFPSDADDPPNFLDDDAENDVIVKPHSPTPKVKDSSRQSDSWKSVIPTIVEGYLVYLTQTLGKPMTLPSSMISRCKHDCESKKITLVCLYFDHKHSVYLSNQECHISSD